MLQLFREKSIYMCACVNFEVLNAVYVLSLVTLTHEVLNAVCGELIVTRACFYSLFRNEEY